MIQEQSQQWLRWLDKTASSSHKAFAYTLFCTHHGTGDMSTEHYAPLFKVGVGVVQTVHEMMWDQAKRIPETQFERTYFSDIVTLLALREDEWTPEFRETRFQQFLDYYSMLYTAEGELRNEAGDRLPRWWLRYRGFCSTVVERKRLEAYYQDQWVWEDSSEHNRKMWDYLRKLNEDNGHPVNMWSGRMLYYYREWLLHVEREHKRVMFPYPMG